MSILLKNSEPDSTSGEITTKTVVKDNREDMRKLLETILRELVVHPDDVKVDYEIGQRTTVFHVRCSRRVIGQVLGSRGKHIQGLRAILLGMTSKAGYRSIIEIPYFDPKSE